MLSEARLNKVLALLGTALVILPILSLVFSTIGALARGEFRFDYLIPAQMFPFVLTGGALLVWASVRTRCHRALVCWGFGVAVVALALSAALPVIDSLVSGTIETTGIWWTVALILIAVYTLMVPELAFSGVLLVRDLLANGSTDGDSTKAGTETEPGRSDKGPEATGSPASAASFAAV